MRYFLHIAYKGNDYFGWQRQANKLSVQEIIEDKLAKIFKKTIPIHGCGRTDSGVHASQYFFHTDIEMTWNFDLLFRLNSILPDDISVFDIIPVKADANARFDAIERTYDYYIHTYKDPFLNEFSSFYLMGKLDLAKMKKAVDLLPQYEDYRAFCKSPNKNENTICQISSAQLFVNEEGNRIKFSISSNRFLARMIRIIVYKLIQIGDSKLSLNEFESLLISKSTNTKNLAAHPQGLYLSKINYPYINLENKSEFMKIEKKDYWQEIIS